jgi:hypothetical protein
MVIVTDTCRRHGHPEFVLEADEAHVPAIYLENIAQTLQRMVAQGSVFRPGETFQIGWMLTRVESYGGDRLTLTEPDMKSLPARFIPGISETLRQMMLQLFMLDSVSLRAEIDMPTLRHSLVACTRYADPAFYLTRSATADPTDSGWFVGCLADDHNHHDPANLTRVSLYEAFLRQPAIQGFLAFPRESLIAIDPRAGVRIYKGERPLQVEPGSFLDAWMKRLMAEPGESVE